MFAACISVELKVLYNGKPYWQNERKKILNQTTSV
jgi:hypothetical protein